MLVGGESLARCFCRVKACSSSGSVSVRAVTLLSPEIAWLYLSPLDTAAYIPCSLAHLMSMPASLKTSGEQLWMDIIWIVSLGGVGVNSDTVLWLETSLDFGDECLLRPVVQWVYKRLGTLLVHTLPFVSLGLESTGLLWPKQLIFWCLIRSPGRFWIYSWRILLRLFSY